MSFGEESGVGYDADTARGREWPSVRQFNVFLGNRLGALLDLIRKFEQPEVRVVSLAVVETADCAIIRLVPSNYERGYEILTAAKFAFTESDLLVVKLPDDDRPLLTITKALLSAEINICYMYPLLIGVGPLGNTAVAVYVDDFEGAAKALEGQGFTLFTENDLKE
jgi:hypothetical protein